MTTLTPEQRLKIIKQRTEYRLITKKYNMEIKSHDTFVIGLIGGRARFIKSYCYHAQKEEAQRDLDFVQDKTKFDGWYISHVGGWILKHKHDVGDEFPISIGLEEMSRNEPKVKECDAYVDEQRSEP